MLCVSKIKPCKMEKITAKNVHFLLIVENGAKIRIIEQ
jgi:hypothetical protein